MAQKNTYQPTTAVKTAGQEKPVNKITAEPKVPAQFIFTKENYKWWFISIAIVIIGFILMSGATDIYSDTKIVVAPLVVLAGFAVGFFAIFRKPAKVN